MFKKLFITAPAMMPDDASANQGRGLGALRAAYSDWRGYNDIVTIVAALERLSNRRLHMIGLRREDLFDAVGDMMDRTEENRAIGQEILAILDAPARTIHDRKPTPQFTENVEDAAAAGHFQLRCSIPRFDSSILSQKWAEALWGKFVTGAPRPGTSSEPQYSDRSLRPRR